MAKRTQSKGKPASGAQTEQPEGVVSLASLVRQGDAGRPANRREQVSAPPWTDKFQRRVGSALSPQYMTAVNRTADTGRMSAYADLLDELRAADPHLDGVLFKRCARVASARWEVAPARTRRKALAKETREFADEMLRTIPSFSSHLLHLLGAVYHSRSAVECVWGNSSIGFVPLELFAVHPRRLSYSANNWKLHLYDETGAPANFAAFPGTPLSDFPPGKFVAHQVTLRGEYPTREGVGRIVQWYSMFKRWGIRDWMALAELAGRPGRIGYYGTGGANPELRAGALPQAKPAHIDDLEYALQEWSGAAWAVLPDTVKAEFVNVAAGYNDLHERLIRHLNNEISKVVLGGTLTTDPGDRGARSLGDTQQDEQLMIARWDAQSLSETITQQLVAPAVRANFGDDAPIPVFTIDVTPARDRNELAKFIQTLVEAGLDVSQEWAQSELNIPAPRPGQKLLIPREPVEVDAAGVPVNTDPSSAPGANSEVKRVAQPQPEPAKAPTKETKP